MSDEALAVAATMPATHRREPELGQPPSVDDSRSRPAGLWPPVLLGTMALLALAAVAVHFVLVPLDVLIEWWKPATVTVTTEPSGAEVLLDGVKLSSLTPMATAVTRDRYDHVLELSHSGYRRVHEVVRYDRSRVLTFATALQKTEGKDPAALRFVPLGPVPSRPDTAAVVDGGASLDGAAPAGDARVRAD